MRPICVFQNKEESMVLSRTNYISLKIDLTKLRNNMEIVTKISFRFLIIADNNFIQIVLSVKLI